MVAVKWVLTALHCVIIIIVIMTALVGYRAQSAHIQQQQQTTLDLFTKDMHNFQVDQNSEGYWNRISK